MSNMIKNRQEFERFYRDTHKHVSPLMFNIIDDRYEISDMEYRFNVWLNIRQALYTPHKCDSNDNKLHWYLFAYEGRSSSQTCAGHKVVPFTDKSIKARDILNAMSIIKNEPGNTKFTICIMSINYLGYMTAEEFNE